jgi:hypothetical protein
MTMRLTELELAGLVKKGPARGKAKAAKSNSAQRLQALGRLPKGQLNKTEQRYADHLAMRVLAGEVLWWKFEGMKFMIAPNTSLTPDFNVMLANGELHMIDTKGSLDIIADDAHAKTKVAASMFPFSFFYAVPRGRTGYEWALTKV